MSYIAPDEHIILMDWPHLGLGHSDLLRLRELGIRTAYTWLDWDVVEPQRGQYDWHLYDAIAERYNDAGMKLLLMCHSCAVDFLPEDCYVQGPQGLVWRRHRGYGASEHYTIISPWSEQGQGYELDFMRRTVEHFRGADVHVIRGGPHGAEVILPGFMPCWYDTGAIASYRAFVGDDRVMPADLPTWASMAKELDTVQWLRESLDSMITMQQAALMGQKNREVWFCTPERAGPFAEQAECGPRSCNWVAREMYDRVAQDLDAELNTMLFEAFRPHGTDGIFDRLTPGQMAHTWTGSQFCQGLNAYTDEAIRLGLRGFTTAPVHPGSGCTRLEPWMIEAFRNSLAKWERAR